MLKIRTPKVKFMELLCDGLNRDKQISLNNVPRRINRFIGSLLAWIFLQTITTANQVTILLIISYYVGITMLALGGFWVAITGIGLILFGDALDLADGIVGRKNIADGLTKNKVDRFRVGLLAGEHHEGMPGLIIFALSVQYTLSTGNIFIGLIGCLGALFEAKTFHLFRLRDYVILRSDINKRYGGIKDTKSMFAESPFKQKLIKFLSFPLTYLIFIVLIALVVQQIKWVLLFYGIFIPFRFFAFFVYTYIRFKKLEESRVEN